jgi:hypothetical protein
MSSSCAEFPQVNYKVIVSDPTITFEQLWTWLFANRAEIHQLTFTPSRIDLVGKLDSFLLTRNILFETSKLSFLFGTSSITMDHTHRPNCQECNYKALAEL